MRFADNDWEYDKVTLLRFYSTQPLVLPLLEDIERFLDVFLPRPPMHMETPVTNSFASSVSSLARMDIFPS